MNSKPPAFLNDKVEYIYCKLLNRHRRFQIVTTRAIQKVLAHKFNDPKDIREKDVEQINYDLRVPLRKDTISLILQISSDFNSKLAFLVPSVSYDEKHDSRNKLGSKHPNSDLPLCA